MIPSREKNIKLSCVPIHNRSRYVDLEIEARNDEPIEDFAFCLNISHPYLFVLLYNRSRRLLLSSFTTIRPQVIKLSLVSYAI